MRSHGQSFTWIGILGGDAPVRAFGMFPTLKKLERALVPNLALFPTPNFSRQSRPRWARRTYWHSNLASASHASPKSGNVALLA